jgi:hypothetical protein
MKIIIALCAAASAVLYVIADAAKFLSLTALACWATAVTYGRLPAHPRLRGRDEPRPGGPAVPSRTYLCW